MFYASLPHGYSKALIIPVSGGTPKGETSSRAGEIPRDRFVFVTRPSTWLLYNLGKLGWIHRLDDVRIESGLLRPGTIPSLSISGQSDQPDCVTDRLTQASRYLVAVYVRQADINHYDGWRMPLRHLDASLAGRRREYLMT